MPQVFEQSLFLFLILFDWRRSLTFSISGKLFSDLPPPLSFSKTWHTPISPTVVLFFFSLSSSFSFHTLWMRSDCSPSPPPPPSRRKCHTHTHTRKAHGGGKNNPNANFPGTRRCSFPVCIYAGACTYFSGDFKIRISFIAPLGEITLSFGADAWKKKASLLSFGTE